MTHPTDEREAVCANCGHDQFTAPGANPLDVGYCLRCGTTRAATPPMCASCGHERTIHDDGRKHCCWYEEVAGGMTHWCACTRFVAATPPTASAPPREDGPLTHCFQCGSSAWMPDGDRYRCTVCDRRADTIQHEDIAGLFAASPTRCTFCGAIEPDEQVGSCVQCGSLLFVPSTAPCDAKGTITLGRHTYGPYRCGLIAWHDGPHRFVESLRR